MQTLDRPAERSKEFQPVEEARPSWLDRAIVWLPAINREILIYVVLLAIGAALRFWDLGSRAQHHDESLHALYSWYLYTGRGFQADPLMHGPLLFHVTALIYFLFGDSDYTSRILSAVAGTALIGLPYFLRSYLGRWGALILAVLFCFSPNYLYYSRFIRQEATLLLFTLAVAICLWRYLAAPRARYLVLIGLALGLSFADKATTYFTVALFGAFLFLWRWRELLGMLVRPATIKNLSPAGDVSVVLFTLGLTQAGAASLTVLRVLNIPLGTGPVATIAGVTITQTTVFAAVVVTVLCVIAAAIGTAWGGRLWWGIAATFFIPYFLLYTTMLTNLPGFGTGLWGMMAYWTEQHGVQRGNQPGYYYLILTVIYEFLPAILGIVGAIGVLRRSVIDPFGFFLIFWAIGSYILYSFAGEKMPWLVVHPILPLMVLGARTVGTWTESFPVRLVRNPVFWLTTGAIVLGLAIVGLLISVAAGTGSGAGNYTSAIRVGIGLLTLILLAGYVFRQRTDLGASAVGRAVLVALLIVGFGLTVRAAWQASYYHGDIPVEMMVYTQTSPDVPVLAERIRQTADLNGGRGNPPNGVAGAATNSFPVTVDSTESFTWPWAWYLRDFSRVDYPNMNNIASPPIGQVLLLHASNVDQAQPYLDKYGPGQRYRLRWWFPEDYRGIDLPKLTSLLTDGNVWKTWWRYFLYRDLVNPLGSSDGVAYFPKEAGAPVVAAPRPPAPSPAQDVGAPTINPPSVIAIGGQRSHAPGQFNDPKGVAVDAAGNLYVLDTGNQRIQMFNPQGQFVTQVGSPSPEGQLGQAAPLGTFKEPWGIAVGPDGNVYVADTWNHRIQKFDANLNPLTQWGSFGDAQGVLTGNPGQFYGPRSIVFDKDGNLYVTDTGNKRIQKFTPDGQFLGAFGGGGSEPGKFAEPVGLATDAEGNFYVADTWNKRVQKFDPSFRPVAQWPVPGWASTSVINKPYLAVAPNGNLYASDPEAKRIFEYGPDGQIKAVIGGAGGPPLSLPVGVAAAPDGGLWVADATGHKVEKFDVGAQG
ncbi:MAG TPA: flippase activity-associated protein Agl23 [Dehalococcoidia bacterium]|nr:flippase activity-associated protein Agl23 [Dehalococcoidia bacterium]